MLKRSIRKLIPSNWNKQITNFFTLLSKYGQYASIKNSSCIDASKNEIPWYTYPAIEYFNNIDFSNKTIFEYGSGNSSIYWAKRAKSVTSVEDNKEWYEKVNRSKLSNQKLFLRETEDTYVGSIGLDNRTYDVIIIDGKYRELCGKIAHSYLSDEGFIILDNSDWYKNTSKYLRESLDLIQIDFHGFGPINNYTWTTSIFLKRNVSLKPVNNIQPHYSVGSLKHNHD